MDIIIDSNSPPTVTQAQSLATQGNALLNFLTSLGYKEPALPLADLLKHLHQLKGKWVIVSPIHWEATHNDASIVACGEQLALDEQYSRRLFSLYAAFLAEEGIALHYHDPFTWLLCCDNKPSLHAKPVYQMLNQSLMPELAQLDTTLYWQKLFTETQMFFAQQQEDITVNGVWFWGGAPLAEKKAIAVCVDEPYAEIAALLSSQVSIYQPSMLLKNYAIVLLKEAPSTECINIPTHWYWNNLAYTIKPTHYLTRLWRKLFHAH